MTLATLRATTRTTMLLFAAALAACGSDAGPNDPDNGGNGGDPDEQSAYVVTGRVTDPQGRPLPGAEVVADNQVLYNSNVLGRTDANGEYRIELPEVAATWAITASTTKRYQGQDYRFDLETADEQIIAGNAGGVVDFAWRLTGEKAGGGYHGGTAIVYASLDDYGIEVARVELTLTPDGPLVDGSAGQAITGTPRSTGDGDAIEGVPIGQYTVTARYAPAGEPSQPLLIRRRNNGTYESSLNSSFDAPYGWELGIYRIDVEVRRP